MQRVTEFLCFRRVQFDRIDPLGEEVGHKRMVGRQLEHQVDVISTVQIERPAHDLKEGDPADIVRVGIRRYQVGEILCANESQTVGRAITQAIQDSGLVRHIEHRRSDASAEIPVPHWIGAVLVFFVNKTVAVVMLAATYGDPGKSLDGTRHFWSCCNETDR